MCRIMGSARTAGLPSIIFFGYAATSSQNSPLWFDFLCLQFHRGFPIFARKFLVGQICPLLVTSRIPVPSRILNYLYYQFVSQSLTKDVPEPCSNNNHFGGTKYMSAHSEKYRISLLFFTENLSLSKSRRHINPEILSFRVLLSPRDVSNGQTHPIRYRAETSGGSKGPTSNITTNCSQSMSLFSTTTSKNHRRPVTHSALAL